MRDWNKSISVRPAQCQHTESFDVFHFHMVKYSGDKLCFLVTAFAEGAVIKNENISAVIARQRAQKCIDDPFREQCCKMFPMNSGAVQKAIDRIF